MLRLDAASLSASVIFRMHVPPIPDWSAFSADTNQRIFHTAPVYKEVNNAVDIPNSLELIPIYQYRKHFIMKIAAVQAESVWCDLEGSVDKTCALIKQAGDQNCDMIGFPVSLSSSKQTNHAGSLHSWIPFFDLHSWARHRMGPEIPKELSGSGVSPIQQDPTGGQGRRYMVSPGGDTADFIRAVIGFSERDGSTLYLSQSFINPDGDVVHHRRKLKPTHVERYIFGDGQAEDIAASVTTSEGVVIGGLQCWEHLQPLLRYNHYKQGVQVHVAAWPYRESLC
jgi:nitrilase